MNSITLLKNLFDEKSSTELEKYLSDIWNQVWSNNSEINYAGLRLLKTVDKIKNISAMGVDLRNKRVLDIGCGDGTTLLYLRKYFDIEGVGVDISDHIIKSLQKNINDKRLSFYVGDHRDLEIIGNGKFDIVLSFGVIEHFEEYSLALTEAYRTLKPGGNLVLIQPHLFSFGVIQEYCLRLMRKWKFGKQKNFSCFYYRSILRQTGFKNIQFLTKPPYPDMKITRVLDSLIKTVVPFWGHYLYLVAKK